MNVCIFAILSSKHANIPQNKFKTNKHKNNFHYELKKQKDCHVCDVYYRL